MTDTSFIGFLVVALIAAAVGWWLHGMVARPRQAAEHAVLLERLRRAETELSSARAAAAAESAAPEQVARAMAPMSTALERLEAAVTRAESSRAAGTAQLSEQLRASVTLTTSSTEALRRETARLAGALSHSEVRGRWGELHLRRLLESSGLVRNVHFTEQVSVQSESGRLRPDVVLHLGGDRHVVVDAKVSLRAILALEAGDPHDEVAAARAAHAREVRAHVERLASKEYARQFDAAPEFVVMFLPAESLLSEALTMDPSLLDHAFDRDVVLATPTTLMALLRTVAHVWRQDALSANVREVAVLGRELAARLTTMVGHFDRLGSSLSAGVVAYNRTVASLESRVLVTSRRFTELQGIEEVTAPRQVDHGIRSINGDNDVAVLPSVATIGP
jgi:DNA recombination protein RmuC